MKQPFAELVLLGRKKIELRRWNTNFRGEFYIHASKSADKKAMKEFGFEDLPCGYIVGKARLIDVKKYSNEEEHLRDKDLHLASIEWGNYGFILENAKRIEKISAKGKLGFWKFKS